MNAHFVVVSASVAAVLFGCSRHGEEAVKTPADTVDVQYPLGAVERLDFSRMESAVQQQIDMAREALLADPRRAVLNGHLGMLLNAYGELEVAAVLYERARLLNPQTFRWGYYLGVLRERRGERAEAVALLEEAAKRRPDYGPLWVHLGQLYSQDGRLDEAETAFRKALEFGAAPAAGHEGLGRVALARREYAAAVTHLETALAAAPSEPLHYSLAQALRMSGRLDEARTQEVLARKSEPAPNPADPLLDELSSLRVDGKHFVEIGLVKFKAGQLDEAERWYRKALTSDPDIAGLAHFQLGAVRSRQGDTDAAIEHYRSAVKLRPNDYRALNNLGVELASRGLISEAIACYRESLKYKPTHAQAHVNLGDAMGDVGLVEDAIGHYRQGIANDPAMALPHERLARLLSGQGRHAAAAAEWREFLRLEPEDPDATLELATEMVLLGETAEADHLFDEAARLAPDDPRIAVRRKRLLGTKEPSAPQ